MTKGGKKKNVIKTFDEEIRVIIQSNVPSEEQSRSMYGTRAFRFVFFLFYSASY